jgi:tetratricopeptide (TPR) repeat protein
LLGQVETKDRAGTMRRGDQHVPRTMSIFACVLFAAALAAGCKGNSKGKGPGVQAPEPTAKASPQASKTTPPAKKAPLAAAKKAPLAAAKKAPAKPASPATGVNAALLQGRKAYNEWKVFKAVELFQEAVRQSPGKVEPLVELSRALIRKGALHQTLETLERAMKMDEKNASVRLILGHILILDQERNRGLKQLYTALKLEPNNPAVLCGLLYNVKKLELQAAVTEAEALVQAAEIDCPEGRDPLAPQGT